MIITIDGRAGTGKTTVAKRVAKALGFVYFDTGAMYRALTYSLLKQKIAYTSKEDLKQFLSHFSFKVKDERYLANNKDVTHEIRSPEVTDKVSEVAAIQEVREALVELQREYGKTENAVFEGRDIGSVVFPQAQLKIYLTASDEVCAKRRFLELPQGAATEEQVLTALKKRNAYDESRELSPLKCPKGAHVIDTSELSLEQVVQKVLDLAL